MWVKCSTSAQVICHDSQPKMTARKGKTRKKETNSAKLSHDDDGDIVDIGSIIQSLTNLKNKYTILVVDVDREAPNPRNLCERINDPSSKNNHPT